MTIDDAEGAVGHQSLYPVDVRRDVRIPTSDRSVSLSADLYLPQGVEPVPALVTVVPYRKDLGNGYHNSLLWFAQRGYAGVLVDNAGLGSSDGTPHAPWGSGETDDAIAAIDWAAAQPWCDGKIGMWGISHGGFTALRAASRQPPQLRAIIPIMNAVDVERDVMHPGGARGDFLRLALWGSGQLLQQLLPPFINHTSGDEQRRWHRRLHETEPAIISLARLAPGDPEWRNRTVDVDAVTIPALCVGGWQDVYPETTLQRCYEKIQGPKKLIVGPWGHTLPHESPFGAIDFLPITLRWWDHWLRDTANGVMDEPSVSLYVQGDTASWRSYDSWPVATDELVLTSADEVLAETTPGESGTGSSGTGSSGTGSVGRYVSDPSIGALSGLRGVALGALGLPQDQHDDDMRALSVTSSPLEHDITLGGAAEVKVRLAAPLSEPAEAQPIERLVIRLCEVDPRGRSTFITTGMVCPRRQTESESVTLAPAAHRVRAGHRIRVTISDADFPRLVPLPDPATIEVASIELKLPTVTDDDGSPLQMPALAGPHSEAETRHGSWKVTRNRSDDGIEVDIETDRSGSSSRDGHRLDVTTQYIAQVSRESPELASVRATHYATAVMQTGEKIAVEVTVECTQTRLCVSETVIQDGASVVSRSWDDSLEHGVRPSLYQARETSGRLLTAP